ncbi:MAG: MFS transporter [Chloroflexi bacterium]|nr:MFS transporter [Chloroflexota bacterium]
MTFTTITALSGALVRAERFLTGPLATNTRHNVRVELVSSIVYGPFYAALLFIPVVLQRLGATPDIVALYQSQTYLGLFLAAFSVMVIPRRHVVLFLVIVWSLGRGVFLLTGVTTDAIGLLVLATLFWFSDGFPGAAYTDVVRRAYPTDVRGRALSVVRIGMVIAMLIFTPIVGWVLDTAGYRMVFPLAGLFGIVSAWLYTRIRPTEDTQVSTDATGRSVRNVWRVLRYDRRYGIYLMAIVFFGLGALVGIAFYPSVIVDRLHLSYAEVSWLGFAQSFSWILGLVVWGRLVDRLGGPWTMRVCFALSAIIPLAYLWAGAGWMLLPAYVIGGLTSGGIDLAFMNTSIELADPEQFYEYAALQRTVIGVRGLVGPFLGVWLFNLGAPVAIVFGLGAGFSIIAAWLVSRREFRQRARVPAHAG